MCTFDSSVGGAVQRYPAQIPYRHHWPCMVVVLDAPPLAIVFPRSLRSRAAVRDACRVVLRTSISIALSSSASRLLSSFCTHCHLPPPTLYITPCPPAAKSSATAQRAPHGLVRGNAIHGLSAIAALCAVVPPVFVLLDAILCTHRHPRASSLGLRTSSHGVGVICRVLVCVRCVLILPA